MGIIIIIEKKWATYEILKKLYETEKNARKRVRLLIQDYFNKRLLNLETSELYR